MVGPASSVNIPSRRRYPIGRTTRKCAAHLDAQLHRILELMSQHAEPIVTESNKMSPQCGWPLLAGMIHGWHDEARHQGEMYLLYKLKQPSLPCDS